MDMFKNCFFLSPKKHQNSGRKAKIRNSAFRISHVTGARECYKPTLIPLLQGCFAASPPPAQPLQGRLRNSGISTCWCIYSACNLAVKNPAKMLSHVVLSARQRLLHWILFKCHRQTVQLRVQERSWDPSSSCVTSSNGGQWPEVLFITTGCLWYN